MSFSSSGHENPDSIPHDDLSRLELRIAQRADSLSPFYGPGREKDVERWDRAEREEFALAFPPPSASA